MINDTATKISNNNRSNMLSVSDIDNEQYQSHSISDGNIQKQQPKSTKTKMNARKMKGPFKENITISPEIDFLSVMTMTTEINTATTQSFSHPEQFIAKHRMQFEGSKVGPEVNDSDVISFDVSSNKSNDESVTQDDSTGNAVEQDSASSLINEENDDERKESESTIVDVAVTEKMEAIQSELEPKSESLQSQQDSGESESDDLIKEQNDANVSKVDHNSQDEIPLETSTTEMDDLIVKEADEGVDSDDISLAFLEALTTKEIMPMIEETMPITEESEAELKNILTTNQKKTMQKNSNPSEIS